MRRPAPSFPFFSAAAETPLRDLALALAMAGRRRRWYASPTPSRSVRG